MKTHDAFLELAAIAIDFPLATKDHGDLERHLAGCEACARTAAAFRSDAAEIAATSVPVLPERRGAEILATVIHPPVVGHPLRLLAVAALLGLALIGSLIAGGELTRRVEDDLSIVPPVPTSGPTPSSPVSPPQESPTVVFRMAWIMDTGLATDATVVMNDGLVVWADPTEGLTQRHLTASGVEWVRGQLSEYGLLAEDAEFEATQKPGTDPPGGGATHYTFTSYRDGTPIIVSARIPSGFDERYWTASDTLLGLVDLGAAVVDADAWVPDQYWVDEPAPFEPVRYLFSARLMRGFEQARYADVDSVEWPLPVPPDQFGDRMASDGDDTERRCAVVDRAQAMELARAMEPTESGVAETLRGGEHNYNWSRGPGSMSVNLDLLLPDEVDCAARFTVPAPPALGDTWTDATVPVVAGRPVGRMEAVTAGGPGFVAVGRGCIGQEPTCEAIVWTSVDGRAWVRVPASDATDTGSTILTSGPEIGMYDVAANDRGVVAIGYAARPDMQATAWYSPDGVAWERIPLGDAGAFRVTAVAADDTRFVIVGGDRSDYTGGNLATAAARAAVWTSVDGRTWTRVAHTDALDAGGFIDTLEDPAAGGMVDVVAGPGRFVAVGSICATDTDPSLASDMRAGCVPAAWTSATGEAWLRAPEVPALAGVLNGVAAAATQGEHAFVAVGADVGCESATTGGGACPRVVLTSEDGQAWVRQEMELTGVLNRVTRVGGRFFAFDDGAVALLVSPDGTRWSPFEPDGGPSVTPPALSVAGASRLAATDAAAVWIAVEDRDLTPAAWVSAADE